MKEFITHPQITRIFKVDIDVYGIKSIKVNELDDFKIDYENAQKLDLPVELYKDIRFAAITAKYEDENAIDVHELSDTIKAAIESRNK